MTIDQEQFETVCSENPRFALRNKKESRDFHETLIAAGRVLFFNRRQAADTRYYDSIQLPGETS